MKGACRESLKLSWKNTGHRCNLSSTVNIRWKIRTYSTYFILEQIPTTLTITETETAKWLTSTDMTKHPAKLTIKQQFYSVLQASEGYNTVRCRDRGLGLHWSDDSWPHTARMIPLHQGWGSFLMTHSACGLTRNSDIILVSRSSLRSPKDRQKNTDMAIPIHNQSINTTWWKCKEYLLLLLIINSHQTAKVWPML